MLEATSLVSHTTLEEMQSLRIFEVWNKELHEKKVESQELQYKNIDFKKTRRMKIVDKGVRALLTLQVYFVPIQTDTATS